jgi:hypothetical protein
VPRSRRLITLLAVVLAAGGLSACGKHIDEEARTIHLETEGLYLPLGELKYQVQISRQMNPYDTQDKGLLTGVPAEERELAADETWFAVFLRVQNETGEAKLPAESIEIIDTTKSVFEPIELDETNVFAYRPDEEIPPRQTMPLPDSPAFDTPARGALLLFKLKNSTLDNRPLELEIVSRSFPQQTGIIDLDV